MSCCASLASGGRGGSINPSHRPREAEAARHHRLHRRAWSARALLRATGHSPRVRRLATGPRQRLVTADRLARSGQERDLQPLARTARAGRLTDGFPLHSVWYPQLGRSLARAREPVAGHGATACSHPGRGQPPCSRPRPVRPGPAQPALHLR